MNQRAPEVAPHQPQGGSAPLSQGLADIKWEGGLSSPPFILGGASGQRMEGRPLLWRVGSLFTSLFLADISHTEDLGDCPACQ